jgi:hypothetical protein
MSLLLALARALSSVVIATVALYPTIPVQRTVLVTTTRSLQYSSEMFQSFAPIADYYPAVNVTNNDSVGGIFTVSFGSARAG